MNVWATPLICMLNPPQILILAMINFTNKCWLGSSEFERPQMRTQKSRRWLSANEIHMPADIHHGREQMLQSETEYIDARPHQPASTQASCTARPDHTTRSNREELSLRKSL